MSFFTEITSICLRPIVESNILGATGLSREALAAMFRRDGLFGPDSALSRNEQWVVQSGLRIQRLQPSGVAPQLTARLEVLTHMTAFLLRSGGMPSADAELRLASEGFSKAAYRELWRVVRIARDVFGAGTRSPQIEGSVVLDAAPHWA